MKGRAEHLVGELDPGAPVAALAEQHGVGWHRDRLARHGGRLRGCPALHDRLGGDGQADERVEHHQRCQRHLRGQRYAMRLKHAERPHVGEIDGRHVAGDDGRDGRVPGKARAGDGDVDAIAGGSEQVPAVAERDRRGAG